MFLDLETRDGAKKINDFIVFIESGEEQYKPGKDDDDKKED